MFVTGFRLVPVEFLFFSVPVVSWVVDGDSIHSDLVIVGASGSSSFLERAPSCPGVIITIITINNNNNNNNQSPSGTATIRATRSNIS